MKYNKVSCEEFFALAEEGRLLPLDIPEIQEMNELEARIRDFLRKAEAEVSKGAQIDHLQNVLELVDQPYLLIFLVNYG